MYQGGNGLRTKHMLKSGMNRHPINRVAVFCLARPFSRNPHYFPKIVQGLPK